MIDFFKRLVDLIKVVQSAWFILAAIFAGILLGLNYLGNFLATPAPIGLILGIIIAVAIVLFFAQKALERRGKSSTPFFYRGLLWKPPLFSFDSPTPLCPIPDCGRPVSRKGEPTVKLGGANPIIYASPGYNYHYACPLHGRLDGTPSDMDINDLADDAKFEMRKREQKSKQSLRKRN